MAWLAAPHLRQAADRGAASPKSWEIAHKPNLTGTADAYRPKGSLAEGGERAKSSGDYEAWTP